VRESIAASDETVAWPGVADKGVRVLVVDDERDAVMTLGILLRSEGFEVTLAQNARAVSAVVAETRPHAVLMDIVMPGRSGFDVAAELRRTYGQASPVLIALSGLNDAATRKRAEDSGFAHFLGKPYNVSAVLDLLSTLQLPSAALPRYAS
jgi:CheY-like chemotaxis protein